MKVLRFLVVLVLLGLIAFYVITRPQPLPDSAFAGLVGDAAAGEKVFHATGCASCHMAPDATGDAQLVLSGGQAFPSDFGTFIAPNISPDPEHGIGNWTLPELANALKRGISRNGEHLYPALPYASYSKLELQDIADLYAFLKTLPEDPTPSQPHQVAFPFNQRLLLGGWKFLFLNEDWVMKDPPSAEAERGRYIVEAMAHCAECHTPRNALGAMDRSRWLEGVPAPTGRGVPDISPRNLDWSEEEIVAYLTTGFTPDYDSAGGHMAHVVENFGRLPEDYAADVAAYLKAIPTASR